VLADKRLPHGRERLDTLPTEMSSFIMSGFFGLASGRRVRTEISKSNGSTQAAYYMTYVTSIECTNSDPVSAELRKYSPPGDSVLRDDTIAFVIAKAFVPPGTVAGNILLEAIHIAPVPGDPGSPKYENCVPHFQFPAGFVHGTVAGESEGDPNSVVTFPVSVSDYVRGSTMQTTLTCVSFLPRLFFTHFLRCSWRMDKTSPRWKNVPTPTRNTQITLLGTCFLITPEKNLCVDLDSINLPSTSANFVASGTPVKDATVGNRRKFAARAPVRGVVPPSASTSELMATTVPPVCVSLPNNLFFVVDKTDGFLYG
jgi:hypothetical protein